jgi:hypothetical protein
MTIPFGDGVGYGVGYGGRLTFKERNSYKDV